MISIDASLFAHIENDANLSGVYKLEGNKFSNTVMYLMEYLDFLKSGSIAFPPEYNELFKDTESLLKIENEINKISHGPDIPQKIELLGEDIATKLQKLKVGEKLLMPGGWLNKTGGHAIVYQFIRTENGYRFTVFNAGGGIQYHHKGSGKTKELYNPTKSWEFPLFTKDDKKAEVGHFISRLLKARVPEASLRKKPITGHVLYKEILPSISHINGNEVEPDKVPEDAFTGGQLSGTCSQRCIHQMLKINSPSLEVYERFIFDFKQYALEQYVNACINGLQPLTQSAKHQINLAIENNLKILKTENLFNEEVTRNHLDKLLKIKETINSAPLVAYKKLTPVPDTSPSLALTSNAAITPTPSFNNFSYTTQLPKPIELNDSKNFLSNLQRAIRDIQAIKDPATQYYYLQQLIIKLPIQTSSSLYKDLTLLNHYISFETCINDVQIMIQGLQKNWLNNKQTGALNVMGLSTLALQINIQDTIDRTSRTNQQPSFTPFARTAMHTVIGNTIRNPFWATNHPELDKKLKEMQTSFANSPARPHKEFYDYLIKLLEPEAQLYKTLEREYTSNHGSDTSALHNKIRENKLGVVFLISQHLKKEKMLPPIYNSLIKKVEDHLTYESKLMNGIGHLLEKDFTGRATLDFSASNGNFNLYSPSLPTYIAWQNLSNKISESRDIIEDSPALNALTAEMKNTSPQSEPINVKTANNIQLLPQKTTEDPNRPVSQTDIIARDYFHLRSEPKLQIALTLDYFTRNIAKLSHENDQRYVEANLFQPGLLIDAMKTSTFFPQFDQFLKTGFRFFNKNGQCTRESLLFFRLDYLVSHYLYLSDQLAGVERLKNLQETLMKQLSLPNDPDEIYFLQQCLFLTVMTRLELSHDMGIESDKLFEIAFKSFFYIQSHADPLIFNDINHRIEVDSAITKFRILASQKPESKITPVITNILATQPQTQTLKLKKGKFPIYELDDTKEHKTVEFNIVLGKIFEKGLARSGLPLALRNHQLIKHLNLQDQQECLITADEQYIILPNKTNQVRLFYKNKQLTVQKNWTIADRMRGYELQPLTRNHLAKHANSNSALVSAPLPLALTDGTSDYWHETNYSREGILVQNNIPVYAFTSQGIMVLDQNGRETSYKLSVLEPKWRSILNNFESNNYLLTHKNSNNTIIKLPRYNLQFEIKPDSQPYLVFSETGERVVENQSPPIASDVAGFVLSSGEHSRYLVPVARFYATTVGAEQSEFYPVVHDTQGTIADSSLAQEWKKYPPQQQPMWRYQGSEKYISLRLHDGKPVADTVADALYLAYMYLATHQPEMAWKTLEDCNTRLGGLTGDPAELQFIAWICKDLPHILPESQEKKAKKKTPPYVACQLKAMSLVSDFLQQDRKFSLKEPNLDSTANSQYARIQHQGLENFLKTLPTTIYKSFDRYQSMGRHLEHTYKLSSLERKSLLDYYHKSQPQQAPLGSLGYEWMNLTIEAIQQEHEALLAREQSKTLSTADKERLSYIETQLKSLGPVYAKSTALERVSINLKLSDKSTVNTTYLSPESVKAFEGWRENLIDSPTPIMNALEALSSNMSDDQFLNNFPAYFQLANSNKMDPKLGKRLLDFCTKTLIANRHIALEDQQSNIPLLCNILYRVANNPNTFYEKPLTLATVVKEISKVWVKPIEVYQAKDIYTKVLASSDELLNRARTKHIQLNATKLEHTSVLEQNDFKHYLLEHPEHVGELEELITSYQKLQEREIGNDIKTEEEAGEHLFALEQEQKTLAKRLIEKNQLGELVHNMTAKVIPLLEEKANQSWDEALKLANEGPDDSKEAQKWEIEKHAKARPTLTKAALQAIYCRADLAFSIEKTGLSAAKVNRLHNLIHQSLFQDIQLHVTKNINKNLLCALKNNDENLAFLALDALARENIPGLEEPATVIIQHEEDILLRTRQVSALKSLLEHADDGHGFKERIEKVIPGGGKSKVILPVAAEKKAEGDNLVVLEVPPALLETNYVDFNRSSQRLFGKKAYRFTFDRDSNSAPDRLKQIYEQFIEIMTTRSYMVTTGDSMQSLELKYIELLLSNERDKNWEEQVYWLDKITNLLHHNADCLIDEVHQGLWLKKKLNYTSGDPIPLDPALIKYATALFSFVIDLDLKNQEHKVINFLKDAPNFDSDYDWTPFKEALATKLVKKSNSPLQQFVAKAVVSYGAKVEDELIAYIMGTSETMSEAVINATSQEKELLAFLKQQVSVLLPETLHYKLNTRYGATKLEGLSPVEYTLAIPFSGNDNPSEGSRFGNELEAINYTLQMMLHKGLSKELFKERIAEWQAIARQELFQNPTIKNLDEAPTARGLEILEEKSGIEKSKRLTLSQINIDDPVQMAELHKRHQYNHAFIFPILQERSLKLIHHDGSIIHSDSFNHIDIYRSAQGVSGTPGNHTTFHQRLHYDVQSSLGSDGYIVQVLHNKKATVSSIDYQNAAQFIRTALTNANAPDRVRAIVDVNATFTGVTNLEVATEIASFIRDNSPLNKMIKHVLYFNDKQILCALDVNKLNAKPIILGTSDEKEISRLLHSTPEERFTYYDQIHTLGTDIKQFDTAHALILADEKDSFQAVIQGNLRMRGLAQKQTLEFIVPKRLAGISLQGFIERLVENDKKTLWMDNLFATKAQMTNVLRRTALSLVQDLPSKQSVQKAELAKKFEKFFVEVPTLELFTLYGAINKKQATKDILDNYQNQLMRQWAKCCEEAQFQLLEKETTLLTTTMENIISTALPHCLKEYEGLDDSLAKEVQVQKQVQKQVHIERVSLNDCFNPQLQEAPTRSWPRTSMKRFFMEHLSTELTMPLNDFCKEEKTQPHLFSAKLRISINYAITHNQQQANITAYLKPVFLIWYHIEYGVLHATIITPQEAKELEERIQGLPENWISTTLDTLIAGQPPKDILNDGNYQILREQVRFFNGELGVLLNQETPLYWLQEKPVEKLNYFENKLQRYRPGSEIELPQVKAALTQGNVEGFIYIAKNPFEDLRNFNWKSLFPKTIPVQAAEYQKVAEAFVYVNKNWAIKDISLDEIQGLSLSSLTYVDTFIKHLLGIKTLLQQIRNESSKPFLYNLNKEEEHLVEECLGMPLLKFFERYTKDFEESGAFWHVASIEVLHIMRKYPALQNKADIMECFEGMVAHASDPAILCALLKAEEPSKRLLNEILNHGLCDASVVNVFLELSDKQLPQSMLITLAGRCETNPLIEKLLQRKDLNENVLNEVLKNDIDATAVGMFLGLTDKLSEKALISLAMKCTNNGLVDQLLQRKDISEKVLQEILKKDSLNSDHLSLILKQVQNSETLKLIYHHQAANLAIRKTIYQHPALTPPVLLSFLTLKLENEELLHMLQHSSAIDKKILEAIIAKKDIDLSVLLASITHSKINPELMDIAIDHPVFSTEIAQEIIKQTNASAHPDLLKKLTTNVFKQYEIQKTEEWENCLIPIFEKYEQQSNANNIIEIIKQHKQSISPRLGINIFRIFGKSMLEYLPLTDIIEHATRDTLTILIDRKQTGTLPEDILLLLAKKCSDKQLVRTFLERDDLTDLVLQTILDNDAIDLVLLLHLLGHAKDITTLQIIYEHHAVSDTIRREIYKHHALSSAFVLHCLTANQINSNDLLLILDHRTAVDETVLLAIAKNSFDVAVLEKIIFHSKITLEVMKLAIDNKAFSVIAAQGIIRQTNLPTAHEVLKKLTYKAFELWRSGNDRVEWEHSLVELFKKYTAQQKISLVEIKEIIKEQKPLSPSLGFHILDLFGIEMLPSLPLDEMIEAADESSLFILLNPEKTGLLSEEKLLSIAQKCTTNEHVDSLLERDDITEKVLHAVLSNTKLDEAQLLKILHHAKNPETLELVFNYKTAMKNIPVREAIYKHPSLSSELVRSILAENDDRAVTNHEVLQILKHQTAIDEKVLETLANKKVNSDVLAAIVSHTKITPTVISLVVENEQLSAESAVKIITTTNVPEHHEILKKLTRKALIEHVKPDFQIDWENCLQELFKTYPEGADKTSDIKEIIQIQGHNVTPKIGLVVLNLYGKDMQAFLPIADMIKTANEEEVKLLVDPEKTNNYLEAELLLLAEKCTTDEDVKQLSTRDDVTEPVLLELLKKTLDYDNLSEILKHKQLGEKARINWFNTLQSNHEQSKKNATGPKEQLTVALESLRIKAYSHTLKSFENKEKYEEVAKQAIHLHRTLVGEYSRHLKDPSQPQVFKENCEKAINDAQDVLGTHRGYKQTFANILNVLLAVVTFRFTQFGTGKWRFFETKTESAQISENIKEHLPKPK